MIASAKKLTVSKTLFLSHLLLALVIIGGMSVARYESEWYRQVNFSATLAKQSLQSQIHPFSAAVGGINYAAMTLPSTIDTLSAIENMLFVEISGVSDFSRKSVVVRYVPNQSKVWRADLASDEVKQSADRVNKLTGMLKLVESYNTLQVRKLNYLLERAKAEQRLLANSVRKEETFELKWEKPTTFSPYYSLDESTYTLHVLLPLRNQNGGSIWAVFDAQELRDFKQSLTYSIVLEALIALSLASLVVYWVAYWIVRPLKRLADSMSKTVNYRSLDGFPELERSDEIGQLAQAYRGLLLKIDQQLDSLRAKSDADSLTGLGSRYKYSHAASTYIERNLRAGKAVGLLICDIDNFKAYNDIYGHMQGDKALVTVAAQLQSKLTNVDLAFRYGGEEFVILCCRRDKAELERVGEQMRRAVEEVNLSHSGNAGYGRITISIGGSLAQLSQAQNEVADFDAMVESLFSTADKALYECKKAGRNRTAWASVFYPVQSGSYPLLGCKK
ncbi:GGDEF domain-containing protein [Vibrio panuliri]|uniref:diguanylate cyclase n=1 Tax=Vibrio panuliri TaxID=1381081 RepID=A0ABX3FNX3_9VIBR|nr:GGDEF domain-containing protein [Vibrio panuliri]KAB1454692.1 diguanylate cyclase [Vibrio panuliri]OLQ94158.1 diguanylate cyclase [Vibrio panuliri]